jgi:putative endonuclease
MQQATVKHVREVSGTLLRLCDGQCGSDDLRRCHDNLERLVWEHRSGEGGGFTSRYGLTSLVYIEVFDSPGDGIVREKGLKGWRSKKLALIDELNPDWEDLARDRYR